MTASHWNMIARVTMEEHISRALTSKEAIHHIDGDITNNEISNLKLMLRSEHTQMHMKGNQHALGHHFTEEEKTKFGHPNNQYSKGSPRPYTQEMKDERSKTMLRFWERRRKENDNRNRGSL